MYCINCGVKLAKTEQACPLCGTVVCHPDFPQTAQAPTYPRDHMPKSRAEFKAFGGIIIILFMLPLVISFFSDLQANGRLDWFGFVAGALVVNYVTLALPLWFKRPNPVIFVPCGFAASALYLFYINFSTDGNWFWQFALPIIGGLCIITCSVITLVRYVKGGRLYIFGGAFIALGGLIFLLEYLLHITFFTPFSGWSVYPLAVLVLLGCLLIYLAIDRTAREILKRKLFF